jgi:hypothetical protein
VGFANSIKTVDGGSHMDGLRAALTRLVNVLAKKNKVRVVFFWGGGRLRRPLLWTWGHLSRLAPG